MKGVIAAGDPLTVAAGAEILERGGNAVDAAVASAFVSFIAEIGVVHLGGSGIAQVLLPANGRSEPKCISYDFFSAMPGLGKYDNATDLDFEKVVIDFGPISQEFYLGRGSVAVPGNIFGLCKMAAEHGRLPMTDLLEPAIRLARNGLDLAAFQADTCQLLAPIYTHTEEMRNIFERDDRIISAGERLFVPDLAVTLESLARQGKEYARSGWLAQSLVEDQMRNGGLLTADDLEQYQVYCHRPIRLAYREFEVLLPPPSSSGGVLTAFSLKLLSHFNINDYKHGSASHLRLLHEVMAATTRARPVWERASDDLPVDQALNYFLSDTFLDHYVKEVKQVIAGNLRLPALSEPSPAPDTSHISVIDGDGMAVSLTTTAGESAGYVVPGTGYIPNNILGEADLHPAGFHQRPPGQRIPTMMTPVVVLLNNRIRLVVGSGGSIRIRSAIMQVLSNLLDFKMRLVDAVEAPRVHLEEGVLQCEFGFEPAVLDELETQGYAVNRWDKRSIYFGGAHSVSRTTDGKLVAAGDNRRGGSTARVN